MATTRGIGLVATLLLAVTVTACSAGDQGAASMSGQKSGSAETATTTTATPSGGTSAEPTGTAGSEPDSTTSPVPTTPATGAQPTDEFATAPAVGAAEAPGQLAAVTATNDGVVDTLTFEFDSAQQLPGYRVELVPVLTAGPNGDPVDVSGSAFLKVSFSATTAGAAGPLPEGIPTNEELDLPLLQQIVLLYNVGGDLQFGIGLAEASTFRVQTLSEPARLVIELQTS